MAYNLKPRTREENFLGLIADNPNAVEMKPITRKEKILANIAGEEYQVEPRTRKECFLSDVAENSGGGGGGDYSEARCTLTFSFPAPEELRDLDCSVNIPSVASGGIFSDCYFEKSIAADATSASSEHNVPLYKGKLTSKELFLNTGEFQIEGLSVAGDATLDPETNELVITGDFTLSFTGQFGGK